MKVRYDIDVIMAMLPHRFPFLLLDCVIELEPGKSAVGIKTVSINEPYFQGHFPIEPIVPGVLLVESLAQITAVINLTAGMPKDTDWLHLTRKMVEDMHLSDRVGYLADIRNIKFKETVHPGDTLELHAVKKAQLGMLSQVQVFACLEGRIAVEGLISVSQKY